MNFSATDIPRSLKKCLNVSFDLACVLAAVTCAVMLRMGELWPIEMLKQSYLLYPLMGGLALGFMLFLRIPDIRLSSFDQHTLLKNGILALLLGASTALLNWMLELGAPRTVPMIAGVMVFVLSICGKLLMLRMLQWLFSLNQNKLPVAIYGAGAAGLQLLAALKQTVEFRPIAIVDDNPTLHGMIMSGLVVQSPRILTRLSESQRISRVLIAMPSVSMTRRSAIARELSEQTIGVHIIPGHAEILQEGGPVQALRPVSSNNLLGRDSVDLNVPEIDRVYAGRTVMVTGAGGSIGSELCHQILQLRTRRIVLYELSEIALYSIERQLIGLLGDENRVEICAVLGSVCDRARLDDVLSRFKVDVILHAAAYKHVPLIEMNEIEGARNNILGTQCVAEAAVAAGIEHFILISTDKAVRPTSVMGATKRIAEIIVQDLQTRHETPRFAIVRFGNVLDSTGSVVPLFREQIAAGGPVTLTHPEVTRYFMSLSEAACLVLLVGAYAKGGDTFVLDMGEPVKIIDLARQMIELSGLSVRNEANPCGNVEIQITGLRPGEKLYEELLIGQNMPQTPHPKILRAKERFPSQIEVSSLLREISHGVNTQSTVTVRNALAKYAEGYSDYRKASKSLQKYG